MVGMGRGSRGWGGREGGDHTAGRASQLAEVMDSWLHLRKWHGLDLLSEMHGSICLHSSQRKKKKKKVDLMPLREGGGGIWQPATLLCVSIYMWLLARTS